MTASAPRDPGRPVGLTGGGVHVVAHTGAEPRIVLIHGAMDRSTSFGRVARHLSDLAVVRYDRRGYGRSRELGPTDLAGHLDDLVAVVGDGPVLLVGHSVGGVVALAAPSVLPAVVGVVAYEAPMPWAPWWPTGTGARSAAGVDPAEAAERFMRRMVGDRVWARLPPSTREHRRSEGRALRADLDLVASGSPYDPVAVRVPVLALAGSETSWWHRRAAEELATLVPLGTFGLVDGAGHGAHLTHPFELAGRIRTFRHDVLAFRHDVLAPGGPARPVDPTSRG